MFDKRQFVLNIAILVVIFSVLYAVSSFSRPIQQQIGSVLGMSTATHAEFSGELQSDLKKQLETTREKGMDVTVGEVAGTVSKGKKILHDFHSLQEEIKKKVEELTGK